MSFKEAIQSVFSNYATFSGRARRSEYWYFVLFNLIISVVLGLLANVSSVFSIVSGLYSLAVLIPGLAVCVRRLHDTGKSGWFMFLVLIPIVGSIIILVFTCMDSVPDNQYGPNPKNIGTPNSFHY